MCDHPNREEAMVTLVRDDQGCPTVWCDPCIANIVAALNIMGLATVASCCGHGRRPGCVALADGRELIIAGDYETARAVDAAFPSITEDRQQPSERGPTETSWIKIGYVRSSGRETTAYVREEPDSDGLHRGFNKHSDEPVTVRWTGGRWEEVAR